MAQCLAAPLSKMGSDDELAEYVKDAEEVGYGEDEDFFRAERVRAMREYLHKERGMSIASVKELIAQRIKIHVEEVAYDGSLNIETLTVHSRIQAADDPSKALELHYIYHHRCRWSQFDHHAILEYKMHGMHRKEKIFQSTHEDLPLARTRQIEKRVFHLCQHMAQTIRDQIFGETWSTLDALLVCYAAVGVCYRDDRVSLPSAAEDPSFKEGWLEHYTRQACQASTEADEGYESEPFAEKYQRKMERAQARMRKRARDVHGDEEDEDYDDDSSDSD